MNTSRTQLVISAYVALALLFGPTALPATAQDLKYTERVIAGGPDKFVEVRHVVLKGSNRAIGTKIGQLAKQNGVPMAPSKDTILNRAKREYMARTYPILFERMRGIADSFGLDVTDDSFDFTGLFQTQLTPPPACSVVFYPAGQTLSGHSILSRNYDFATGDTWTGRRLPKGKLPAMARPYLFEMHPDRGYSSLSLCAFEYLGGVLEGINSEGLAVSILSVGEALQGVGYEPDSGVGVHELMSMRYLLDNCKNVEEAKEALLTLKHYYCLIPCHYIVGDKTGKSFIHEFSPGRNRSYILDGKGPQCITNHLVFRHEETAEKQKNRPGSSLQRYNRLTELTQAKEKFTVQEIAAINAEVATPPAVPSNPEIAPYRTLWYAQYDLDNLTLTVKFYLGEKPDPDNDRRAILEYSPQAVYGLKE